MNVFSKYFIEVLTKRYVNFSGRASRSEFWFFMLFYTIFASVAFSIDVALYLYNLNPHFISSLLGPESNFSIIGILYTLAMFIPSIALIVRRIHDVGKSGLWVLSVFIPIIGFFAYLYFGLKSSQEGENKYGATPELGINKENISSRNKAFDDKDLGTTSKSSKWLKIVGGTFLVLFIIAGVLFFFIGGTIISIAKSMGLNLNQLTVSELKSSSGLVSIEVPLSQQYALKYHNVTLCTPEKEKDNHIFAKIMADGYSTSYSCVNDECEISIEIDEPNTYPKSIQVYTKDQGGVCRKKSLPIKKPTPSGFFAIIDMTPELLRKLNINTTMYDFSLQINKNYTSWSDMGSKKIKLNYDDKISSDTLLIDGKPRASIIFKKIMQKKDNPNREFEMIQDEIQQLKEKRNSLLKRLD